MTFGINNFRKTVTDSDPRMPKIIQDILLPTARLVGVVVAVVDIVVGSFQTFTCANLWSCIVFLSKDSSTFRRNISECFVDVPRCDNKCQKCSTDSVLLCSLQNMATQRWAELE